MIQFCAYQGYSAISRLIRWQTRSKYSHIAIRTTEDLWIKTNDHQEKLWLAGSVIEAWKGGVRMAGSISASHTPGTRVDFFEYNFPLSKTEEQRFTGFLITQLGKPYDYASIIRFLTRERGKLDKKWFCSELAFEAAIVGGYPLLKNCAAWEIPPRDIPRSPLLKFVGSETTV